MTTEGVSEQSAHPGRTAAEAYLDSYVAAQTHFIECLLLGKNFETCAADNFETLAAPKTLKRWRPACAGVNMRTTDLYWLLGSSIRLWEVKGDNHAIFAFVS